MIDCHDDRCAVQGPITMDNVVSLLERGRSCFVASPLTVDLSAVTEVDSSALSLLLEWRRDAARDGRTIRFAGLPGNLRSLAELYGVTELPKPARDERWWQRMYQNVSLVTQIGEDANDVPDELWERLRDERALFDFPAKNGKRRFQEVTDPDLLPAIRRLKRRRGGGPELLAYRDEGGWRDLRSADVNAYVKEVAGVGFSAKDFRTWHATVLAAVSVALSEAELTTVTSRRRVISAAIADVADYIESFYGCDRRLSHLVGLSP